MTHHPLDGRGSGVSRGFSDEQRDGLGALAGALRPARLPDWLSPCLDGELVRAELAGRIGDVVPDALGLDLS